MLLIQTERIMLGRNKIPKYNINKERVETQFAQGQRKLQRLCNLGGTVESLAPEGANNGPCPTVLKQIGKTTYIVRVHFSETAKETVADKKRKGLLLLVLGMWKNRDDIKNISLMVFCKGI